MLIVKIQANVDIKNHPTKKQHLFNDWVIN